MNRTDLAAERVEQLSEAAESPQIEGIRVDRQTVDGAELIAITVETEEGERQTGKMRGRYLTARFPPLGAVGENTPAQIEALAKALRSLLPAQGDCLVVGLGNADITPDALGPQVAGQIFATRHLPEALRLEGVESLRNVSAIAPGVLGQTGMESGEITAALVAKTQPACVIAVDALAAGDVAWLGCTVQMTDTGISPGSGVQNSRKALNRDTLGVPVIAVGVPTVADAAQNAQQPLMVTPRDVDRLIHRAAKLVAMAINRALQPTLSVEELTMLVN